MCLTAFRNGDLVRMPNCKDFRLTSDVYEYKIGRMGFNTDRENDKPISYLKLLESAYLVETKSGRKNK